MTMLTFVFSVTSNGKSIGGERCLDLRVVEVNDGTVVLEHVHLLNTRDVVNSQLLQGAL